MKLTLGSARHWTGRVAVFMWLAAVISAGSARAATVTYTLDNVVQDDSLQMTGSFDWTYTPGEFLNGSGQFTDLYIPGYGTDISGLTISIDIENSIEFSNIAPIQFGGVTVTLALQAPLSPTQSALIDLDLSLYDIERGGLSGVFVSGSITPSAVPVPAAVWLFGSGLIGLVGIARRRKT